MKLELKKKNTTDVPRSTALIGESKHASIFLLFLFFDIFHWSINDSRDQIQLQ